DSVMNEIARLTEDGDREQQDFAITLFAELRPFIARAVEAADQADAEQSGEAAPAGEAGEPGEADPAGGRPSGAVAAAGSGDAEEPSGGWAWWRRVAGEVFDLATDIVPIVSEIKAGAELAYLTSKLFDALERDDPDKAREIATQMV